VSRSEIRQAKPQDYDAMVAVASEWWGRDMVPGLPRLFLDHFWATSLFAEDPEHQITGFLVGFHSPSEPTEAYIHYVAVHPAERRSGLARRMYSGFFDHAIAEGRTVVRAITSPSNEQSIEFHRHMGFTVTGPATDYNGPGRDMVLFSRWLL
jgi:ribosomal protein S18 acetylase RimI-like enzyme